MTVLGKYLIFSQEMFENSRLFMSIPQKGLAEKVCQILTKEIFIIGTDFGGIPLSNSFVAKTANRSSNAKKYLHVTNLTNLDLPEGTKLFINGSLCPYYKGLSVNCKNPIEYETNTLFFLPAVF